MAIADSDQLHHLERLREDARAEIKLRIAQRDSFSSQLVIAVTTAVAIAAAGGEEFVRILLAIPVAVAFLIMMILYSYQIHDRIAAYVRWTLEPQLSSLSGTPLRFEWENYYGRRAIPGLRRRFYEWVLIGASVLFPAIVAVSEWRSDRLDGVYFRLTVVLGFIYLVWSLLIVRHNRRIGELSRPTIRRASVRDFGTSGDGFRPNGITVGVFLDRDGTIIADTHFPHDSARMIPLPGALRAIGLLSRLDVRINVITNQAGVAQGIFSVADTRSMNKELAARVRRSGGRIDAIYFCPDEEGVEKFHLDSPCSKPNPGMLEDAALDQDLDLTASYMVGDKMSDILAGEAAGCTTFLVGTGKAGSDGAQESVTPDYEVADLARAVEMIAQLMSEPG